MHSTSLLWFFFFYMLLWYYMYVCMYLMETVSFYCIDYVHKL